MELREYLKIFRAHRGMIGVFLALGFVSALAFSSLAYQGYQGKLSLVVRPSIPQQTVDFQYNGFYALEASDRVTRMIEQRLKDMRLLLTTRRLGSQYLTITFVQNTESELATFRGKIEEEVIAFTQSLSKYPQNNFEAVTIEFTSKKRGAPFALNSIMGLGIGAVVGFFGALLSHYANVDKNDRRRT